MLIAQEKKKTNIAEYILYMWHIEDLIRGFGMSSDKIANWVKSMKLEADLSEKMIVWYDNVLEMMKNDNVVEKGHIMPIRNNINELTELHLHLLYEEKDPIYTNLVNQAVPSFIQLRSKSGHKAEDLSDVEIALNALYGKLILKIGNKEISEETEKSIGYFSSIVAYLSKSYNKINKDEETF